MVVGFDLGIFARSKTEWQPIVCALATCLDEHVNTAKPAVRARGLRTRRTTGDGVFYRCPACGDEVDQTDRVAVAQHHQHVLHPYLFRGFFRATGDASVSRVTSGQ